MGMRNFFSFSFTRSTIKMANVPARMYFSAMPLCANVGQAAGVAAALAARAGVQPRAVPVADIQAELRRQGVEP